MYCLYNKITPNFAHRKKHLYRKGKTAKTAPRKGENLLIKNKLQAGTA